MNPSSHLVVGAAGEGAVTIGALRVWWIPQVPGASFHVLVQSLHEARLVLDTLARYDLFQLQHRIKGDFANVGGLEVFEADVTGDGDGDGWCEWSDPHTGESIDEVTGAQA